MKSEFNVQYPPDRRCRPSDRGGCWFETGLPDRTYAFSSDGVFQSAKFSRLVSNIDFSNPIWLRLGFTNERQYNWYPESSYVVRAIHNSGFWDGFSRWQLTMPWFVMYRFPASFVRSELCWRGQVLWEEDGEQFTSVPHIEKTCRTIIDQDVGRRVFGIAIKPADLTMTLKVPLTIQLRQIAMEAITVITSLSILVLLVRPAWRRFLLTIGLLGLGLFVVAFNDVTFIGGLRPQDGGNDGLVYDGMGRTILQRILAGDISGALQGEENVFYYGGPGLRYFRAFEHLIFGETYLGYLSLLLLLPFVVFGLFRRFLSAPFAMALILIFVATPIGGLFGTSFLQYVKIAERGFADPAAYVLFLCGLILIVGTTTTGPDTRFFSAFCGALLFALSIFIKPLVSPATAVILGGAGLAALYQREWSRLAGLCFGFFPVFLMPLHNWVYGHVIVLFSANIATPFHTTMPPSAWVEAARELMVLNFYGDHVVHGVRQIEHWLTGPADRGFMIPILGVSIVILIYIARWGSQFEPWLRLIALSALVQHIVALFYVAAPRYYYLTWFITALVAAVWAEFVVVGWIGRRIPNILLKHRQHDQLASIKRSSRSGVTESI